MFLLGGSISRGHAAFRGALALAVGVVCIVSPGITISVVVALFAVYCFFGALGRVVDLFESGDTAGQRVVLVLMALIDLAAGVVAISYPGITAGVLVIVAGIWAIVTGSIELAVAWRLAGSASGWLIAGGVLSVLVGILLIAWPGIGAYSLALVFGIYLLVYGLTYLVLAAMTPRGEGVGDALV